MTSLLLAGLLALAVQPNDIQANDLQANDSQEKLLQVFHAEFVPISPGKGKFPASFQMGGVRENEQPRRRVSLAYSFQIAKYEVPQNLWRAVMGANPSRWKGERNSVEMLSHDEAIAFCKKATELMRAAKLIGEKQVVRLPSESEWEYAARAGATTRYSFGDDAKALGRFAWFTGNAAGNDPPVGAKAPNPWGLYDMHGYLWEWCADHGAENYVGAPANGAPRATGGDSAKRVLRGGSWKDPAEQLESSYRRLVDKNLRDAAVGLRCVLATKK